MSKVVKDEYSVLIDADNVKHKRAANRSEESIKKIILICLGTICVGISLTIFLWGGVFFGMIFGTLFLIAGSTCFANLFWESVAPSIVDGLFNSGGKFKSPPEQLSPIKGLIRMENFSEAIEKLDVILERKPFEPEPYLMLIEIYLEHLKQPQKVVDMIQEYFVDLSHRSSKQKRKKLRIAPENIDMIMIYSDTCQELRMTDQAIELLQQEAARKGYSVPDKHAIAKRLNVLTAA
ncbi:MAG: hypothetical protein L3J71_15740 [Victivallaceae bacterium]|nr:hypothetical protein [Victivallaceae bacterium]